MKRLQRLEFIFLYERFIETNNRLNKALNDGKGYEEVDFLRKNMDILYGRMRDHGSPADSPSAVSGAMLK